MLLSIFFLLTLLIFIRNHGGFKMYGCMKIKMYDLQDTVVVVLQLEKEKKNIPAPVDPNSN